MAPCKSACEFIRCLCIEAFFVGSSFADELCLSMCNAEPFLRCLIIFRCFWSVPFFGSLVSNGATTVQRSRKYRCRWLCVAVAGDSRSAYVATQIHDGNKKRQESQIKFYGDALSAIFVPSVTLLCGRQTTSCSCSNSTIVICFQRTTLSMVWKG